MKILAAALVVGFAVGIIFRAMKLPVPAPPTLEGVMGIVGIFLGYKLAEKLF